MKTNERELRDKEMESLKAKIKILDEKTPVFETQNNSYGAASRENPRGHKAFPLGKSKCGIKSDKLLGGPTSNVGI